MTKESKILSLFAAFVLVVSAFVSTSSAASSNLLVNGNASGGLQGWTTTDNYWKTATSYDKVTAYDSSFFYPQGFKGNDGANTRIYQDVDIRNYAGTQATLSAYVRTWDTVNTDESVLLLEFFDANGRLLDKGSVSSSQNPKWHKINVARTVPSGAVRARVSLIAVYHYGSEVDAYFDNVILSIGGIADAASDASSNLLVNGDASNGLYGWTTIDNYWKTIPTDKMIQYSVKGHNDGTLFYPREFGTKDGETTRIYQDVDIRNYVGRQLTLSAYVRTWDSYNTDETILLLEFFDDNGKLLDKGSVSSNRRYQYHKIQVARTVPNNSVRARVSLVAIYHHGHFADCYFDDVELVAGGTVATTSNPKSDTPSTTSNQKPNTPPATSNPPSKPSNTGDKPLVTSSDTPQKTPAATQNLLVNGNASGGLQGWMTTDNYWKTVLESPYNITPYDGNLFYPYEFKGKDGANTRIYQDVTVREYIGTKLTLSAYVRTWDTVNTDETVLLLEYFDGNGRLLDKGSVSSSKNPQWHKISVVRTVPSGAMRARVSLIAVYHYGRVADSFFDNVMLTAGGTSEAPSNTGGKTPSATSGTPGNTPPTPSNQQGTTQSATSNPQGKTPTTPSNTGDKPLVTSSDTPNKTPAATQNLLVNGNASDGLQGWTTTDNYWRTATTYGKVPAHDSYFFYTQGFKGPEGAETRIYQDVDIRKYAGTSATLSAYVRSLFYGDWNTNKLLIEFFDQWDRFISSSVWGYNIGHCAWVKERVIAVIPNRAVRARVSLYVRYVKGDEANCFFDDVTLTAGEPLDTPSGTSPVATSDGTMMIVYLRKGNELRLGALAGGKEGSSVSYATSDRKAVEVISGGKIRALSAGSSTITAKSGNTLLKIMVIVKD